MREIEWRCSVCGEPVGMNDMVGYVRNRDGSYIRKSLVFWHTKGCSEQFRLLMPADIHIRQFVNYMPQYFGMWIADDIDLYDVNLMIMRCTVPGYEDVWRYYGDASSCGVIEPNLPEPLLWPEQVQSIKSWLEAQRCD